VNALFVLLGAKTKPIGGPFFLPGYFSVPTIGKISTFDPKLTPFAARD
jgi:hypothetical protein